MQQWANDGFDSSESPAATVPAFPVTVGGRVVAILYADAAQSAKPWPVMLEVLTRHASRLLESMTLHKAVGLVPPRDTALPGGAAAR